MARLTTMAKHIYNVNHLGDLEDEDEELIDDIVRGIPVEKLYNGEQFLYEIQTPKDDKEGSAVNSENKLDNVLKYGDIIVLNIKNLRSNNRRQVSAKSVISDTLHPLPVKKNQFSALSRFTILPSSEYIKQQDLMYRINPDTPNICSEFAYDVFIQEGFYNIAHQKAKFGTPVNYNDTIQLYHGEWKNAQNQGTKRYLTAHKPHSDTLENQEVMNLSFSDYPSEFTHFKITKSFYSLNSPGVNTINILDKFHIVWEDELKYFFSTTPE